MGFPACRLAPGRRDTTISGWPERGKTGTNPEHSSVGGVYALCTGNRLVYPRLPRPVTADYHHQAPLTQGGLV